MEFSVWTEKYRPKRFDEVRGQEEVVSRVSAFVNKRNLPHLLFAGPAGVGKTTLALVIARELYGEAWRENTLELNASDERGIDVVRVKVKDFARTRPFGDAPFKLIYLDECDALTREAQQALRRTMENYTQTCRFILSCNYSSKIIDPIQSRCTMFKFKPLDGEQIAALIGSIAKKEGLNVDAKARDAIATVSGGDARRAENVLQSCAALDATVTEQSVFLVASVARPAEVREVLELAIASRFLEARDKLLKTMLDYGLSGLDVIKQLQREAWELEIPDEAKLETTIACGEAEFHMVEGADEFIQLEALLARVAQVVKGIDPKS